MSTLKKDNFLFTEKILLDGDDYIILREPNVVEMTKIDGAENDIDAFKVVSSMFADLIIEHTFTDDTGAVCSNADVTSELRKSSTRFSKIIKEYLSNLPFEKEQQKPKK